MMTTTTTTTTTRSWPRGISTLLLVVLLCITTFVPSLHAYVPTTRSRSFRPFSSTDHAPPISRRPSVTVQFASKLENKVDVVATTTADEEIPFFASRVGAAPLVAKSNGVLNQDNNDVVVVVESTIMNDDNKELGIWAARGILLLVAAIWGTNFASVKYLETLCFHPPCSHPPSEAAFARFGVAAIVGFPLLIKQRWDVILAGLECGLWIALGYVSQATALTSISSAKCAFICSLTVVFVPVVSAVLYNKPIKPLNLVAAMTAMSGVAVLEGLVDVTGILQSLQPPAALAAVDAASTAALAASSMEATSTATTAAAVTGPLASLASNLGVGRGDLLALGQPIGFGYCFTRIEHYQEKFKDVPNRVLTIAAAQCVSVGVLCLFWVLYDYHGVLPNFGYMVEPHRIAAIAWTGIVTTVCAIFLEGIALQTATATDAALAFSSEPVWASLFGFLLLHETLGFNAYVGGVIIMLACLIGAFSDLMADEKTPKEIKE